MSVQQEPVSRTVLLPTQQKAGRKVDGRMNPKLTDCVDEQTMSIGELWESLATFASNRKNDNTLCGEYPIETRMMQMDTLRCFVNAIEEFHEKFKPK